MCRKPIASDSDEEHHPQNRQAVEYAGEPIHRECHPTSMPEPDTDHVAVHEHLMQAQRELSAAVDEWSNEDDDSQAAWNITELSVKVKDLADEYREEHL